MRIGLAETIRLGVPPELATDGAVQLVRRLGCSSASAMVNAVLRKAVQKWPSHPRTVSVDVKFSHPGWVYDRWARNFGEPEAAAMHGVGAGACRDLGVVFGRCRTRTARG